jgi:hypothetical protein
MCLEGDIIFFCEYWLILDIGLSFLIDMVSAPATAWDRG